MDTVTLGRWQFGITTVYHFLFVPITIALSLIVAIFQTMWVRTGQDRFLQLTKFFGRLFLINFALGLVTGIVQEFQFGMNWSDYSRFVGDVFGAPLALEALLAFFLESTFLGLWIFGWDRLPKKLHLATIYLVAFGTVLSAVFILAANSWMQNPVGTVFNSETNRAEIDGLAGFGEVLTNPVFLATFPHVLFGAYMVGGAIVAAVSAWHLARLGKQGASATDPEVKTWRFATKFGAWWLIGASVFTLFTGDLQAKAMVHAQPMKIAAAEGLFKTTENAGFSILTIGNLAGTEEVFAIKVPYLLSILAGEKTVQGIDNLREQYEQEGFLRNDGSQTKIQEQFAEHIRAQWPDIDPAPNVPITYWTFRLMIGLGTLGMLFGIGLLILIRKNRFPKASPLFTTAMFAMPLLPLFANSFGWIFTEMGRQPWVVMGVLPTVGGVSPSIGVAEVITSLSVFTLLYGALAVIEVWLFLKFAKAGLPDVSKPEPIEGADDPDAPMTLAY